MKTYNSPAQARSLREIEAAAASPVTNMIPKIYGDIKSVHTAEEAEKERTETEAPTKKTRSKKNTKEV